MLSDRGAIRKVCRKPGRGLTRTLRKSGEKQCKSEDPPRLLTASIRWLGRSAGDFRSCNRQSGPEPVRSSDGLAVPSATVALLPISLAFPKLASLFLTILRPQ